MEKYHNGFYEDLDNFLRSYPDGDFGFMENNICISRDSFGRTVSAYDFLHGFCNIFAEVLNAKYGYPIYVIIDDNGYCVHCFCVNIVNGVNYYIDVRGITTDYIEFISEFEDFTDEDSSRINTIPIEKYKFFTVDDSEMKSCADEIITQYNEYYVMKKVAA